MPDTTPPITVRVGPADGDHCVIGWDGTAGAAWEPLSDGTGTAATLCRTAGHIAAVPVPGAHHFPPGVAAALEVAARLGGAVLTCPTWPAPLPAGAAA